MLISGVEKSAKSIFFLSFGGKGAVIVIIGGGVWNTIKSKILMMGAVETF